MRIVCYQFAPFLLMFVKCETIWHALLIDMLHLFRCCMKCRWTSRGTAPGRQWAALCDTSWWMGVIISLPLHLSRSCSWVIPRHNYIFWAAVRVSSRCHVGIISSCSAWLTLFTVVVWWLVTVGVCRVGLFITWLANHGSVLLHWL